MRIIATERHTWNLIQTIFLTAAFRLVFILMIKREFNKNAMRADKKLWTDLYFVRICAQVFSLLHCYLIYTWHIRFLSVSYIERSRHKKMSSCACKNCFS
jgi:hypothetical protein